MQKIRYVLEQSSVQPFTSSGFEIGIINEDNGMTLATYD